MPEVALADALQKRKQISITVTGRRTGKQITIPVWFVSERDAIWLLPVYGSNTQWYKNLQKNRAITVQAGSEKHEGRARLLKDRDSVCEVVRQFREKYTPEEIKRWYQGLDVAGHVPNRSTAFFRRRSSAQTEQSALQCASSESRLPAGHPA